MWGLGYHHNLILGFYTGIFIFLVGNYGEKEIFSWGQQGKGIFRRNFLVGGSRKKGVLVGGNREKGIFS